MARRRIGGSVEVSVDVEEVLEQISDRDIREEFEARFGGAAAADFDLLDEVRHELHGGRLNGALALIESAICARLVSDDKKRAAYEAAVRVH